MVNEVRWTFSASPANAALSIRLLLSYSPMLDLKCVWGGNPNKEGVEEGGGEGRGGEREEEEGREKKGGGRRFELRQAQSLLARTFVGGVSI